jgi:hypothetical protein
MSQSPRRRNMLFVSQRLKSPLVMQSPPTRNITIDNLLTKSVLGCFEDMIRYTDRSTFSAYSEYDVAFADESVHQI